MAQLSVLSYPPQYVEQLPSIENFLTHMEGKGRLPKHHNSLQEEPATSSTNNKSQRPPAEVELAIARYKLYDRKTKKRTNQPASTSYKAKLCDCYAMYCKYYKIEWEKPIYTPEPQALQPPTREKAAMLVSAAKGELSMKIDIIRQTGYRPIEIQGEKGLRAKDFHPDQNTLTNRNTKKCNARPALPTTAELATRLQNFIRENHLQNEYILFKGNARRFGEHYRRFRNTLAEKLQDQTIKTKRLYDLRHFYCTEQLRRSARALNGFQFFWFCGKVIAGPESDYLNVWLEE